MDHVTRTFFLLAVIVVTVTMAISHLVLLVYTLISLMVFEWEQWRARRRTR